MTEPSDRRHRSYQVGAVTAREGMARQAPADAAALAEIESGDIVVAPGGYDHVEWVLEALGVPFTVVEPSRVGRLELAPHQLLVINCPGEIGAGAVAAVRRFVEAGGSLFTTDWALRHVLEPAFPGVVAYNERPTADAVVRVEVADHDNAFLKGVMQQGDDPLWWLEGSSYPIRVLDQARVKVLITSGELKEKWGESPVALTFTIGEGEVFHMISHYYLQRTETRTRRHSAPAAAYAAEKAVAWDARTRRLATDLSLTEVESATTSARLLANVAAGHKKRAMERLERERAMKGSPIGTRGADPSQAGGKRRGEGA